MNVCCVNTEREDESSNITNINILITFDKTRDIFSSVPEQLPVLQQLPVQVYKE